MRAVVFCSGESELEGGPSLAYSGAKFWRNHDSSASFSCGRGGDTFRDGAEALERGGDDVGIGIGLSRRRRG